MKTIISYPFLTFLLLTTTLMACKNGHKHDGKYEINFIMGKTTVTIDGDNAVVENPFGTTKVKCTQGDNRLELEEKGASNSFWTLQKNGDFKSGLFTLHKIK